MLARGKKVRAAEISAQPRTRYWLGGKARDARAFARVDDKRFRVPKSLPTDMPKVVRFLAPYTKVGWDFAVLSPRYPMHKAPSKLRGAEAYFDTMSEGGRVEDYKEAIWILAAGIPGMDSEMS
ncbi:MAG: hypothetical protein ABGX04_17970 [Myxococcales bacterium]|nr:hypothetical protein [Myxococcales bacterium]HIK83845.1 hypothetical protein [Myxococcales bacterium]